MDQFTLLKINQRNLPVVFFAIIMFILYSWLISCSQKVDPLTKPSTSNQSKLDNAVTDSPNPDEYTWYGLGFTLYKQGKLDDAIAAYRELLKINPNHKQAWYSLGSILAQQGKLDEAIAAYRKQLEVDPNHNQVWNGLGNALEQQGKLDEAIAAYRKQLEVNHLSSPR